MSRREEHNAHELARGGAQGARRLIPLAACLQLGAISGNQWQSVAIGGNKWQSVAIGGNQWQSVAIRCIVETCLRCHEPYKMSSAQRHEACA